MPGVTFKLISEEGSSELGLEGRKSRRRQFQHLGELEPGQELGWSRRDRNEEIKKDLGIPVLLIGRLRWKKEINQEKLGFLVLFHGSKGV